MKRLNTYLYSSSKKLNDLAESENEIQEVGQENRRNSSKKFYPECYRKENVNERGNA